MGQARRAAHGVGRRAELVEHEGAHPLPLHVHRLPVPAGVGCERDGHGAGLQRRAAGAVDARRGDRGGHALPPSQRPPHPPLLLHPAHPPRPGANDCAASPPAAQERLQAVPLPGQGPAGDVREGGVERPGARGQAGRSGGAAAQAAAEGGRGRQQRRGRGRGGGPGRHDVLLDPDCPRILVLDSAPRRGRRRTQSR